MLFEKIIFGPIKSRRLGISLGINLLPVRKKYCNYNCIYCECGWNEETDSLETILPSRSSIYNALEAKLKELKTQQVEIDSITFAGNGEPTIHPDFTQITEDVITLRDSFCPNAKITVLTNGTKLSDQKIFDVLRKIDNPILKLDSGTAKLHALINKANRKTVNFEEIVTNLERFGRQGIIQTLLFRGTCDGEKIDNTDDTEFSSYLGLLEKIKPRFVMLYGLDRKTPAKDLEKLTSDELEFYAAKIRAKGIEVKVYV